MQQSDIRRAWRVSRLPRVPGEIVSKHVIDVNYRYSVDGSEYTSLWIGPERQVKRFAIGQPIEVAFFPSHPKRSYIYPENQFMRSSAFQDLVGSLLAFILIPIVVFFLLSRTQGLQIWER
ncbi:DUF3592 domain-containing protein [Novipirellula artificiosorum]